MSTDVALENKAAPAAATNGPWKQTFEPIRIVPTAGWSPARLARDLWEYRDLLWLLTWRDIKVRYKQTALGVAWAVIQPAMTMLVFSLFFGRLASMPSDGKPYPVFVFCALLPWQLFSYALTNTSNCLIANERLITKIFFPRLIIPLATTLSGLIDFAVAFVLLLGIMAFYGIYPGFAALAVIPLILLTILASLAIGISLAALNVRYRDVRYALPFLTQFWMFATPIAYSTELVPAKWRALYALNPMVGVVEGFRWAMLGGSHPPDIMVAISSAAVLLGLLASVAYFRRVEQTFADRV